MAKRIKGGRKIVSGQFTEGTYGGSQNHIQLFYGKFTTGYKVVSFEVAPLIMTTGCEISAKLTTETKSTVTEWHWDDVQEVAWAYMGADKYLDNYSTIREDNMIVQDLWIGGVDTVNDGAVINYEIILEKYEFTAWDGAGTMVRNLSQSGPA